MSYGENELKKLVGRKVEKIFMSDEYLRFQTKEGNVHLTVEGGCCSHSFFNDFIGVEKLLKNGTVVSVEEIELKKGEIIKCRLSEECTKGDYPEDCKVYGYRVITEDPTFGEVSSVFSFRNHSNGYYGGSLEKCDKTPDSLPELKKDYYGE